MGRNRFHGILIAITEKEDPNNPGVFPSTEVEYKVFGDYFSEKMNATHGAYVSDNISMSNRISIRAPKHLFDEVETIRSLKIKNTLWRISNIELQYPRMIITLGGLYNE